MSATSIEWVIGPDGSRGHTVNPIRFRNLATGKIGHYCEKIAQGCAHCYSSTMQKPYLSGLEFVASNKDKGKLFFEEKVLEEVLRRRKLTGYFWCDMTDLFGSWVPDEWLDRCFAVMGLTPEHRHYVLTKRGERLRKYFTAADLYDRLENAMARKVGIEGTVSLAGQWPLPSVWLGVSASTRPDLDAQIEHLRATPAAVRFLSLEPLIADLGTIDLSGIGWVIVGGESGPGARPMHEDWVRSVRDQCVAANVPFFFKQWGEWQNGSNDKWNGSIVLNDGTVYPEDSGPPPGQHRNDWPQFHPTMMARVGKKAAGRLLDGREWNELPGGAR